MFLYGFHGYYMTLACLFGFFFCSLAVVVVAWPIVCDMHFVCFATVLDAVVGL